MKKLLREVSRAIVSNRYLWHAIRKTLGRCWALLEAERRGAEGYRLVHGSVLSEGDLVRKLSASGEVLGGPFKGMQYGQIISYGSVLPPKILGFYESEISVVFQNLKCKKFDVIIDIGSAEDYYAVGLARMNKAQLVYAFDINSQARKACRQLALQNRVADRVLIGSFCDAQKLEDIVAGQSAFVVCDCEGYERVLFGALDTTAFETTTFLVEVHDFIDPTISEFIISKLNGTHFVERFFSASSVEKWRQFKGQPFFDEFDAPSQLKMVSEGRPEKMEWLLFQPLEKAALVRSGLYCST